MSKMNRFLVLASLLVLTIAGCLPNPETPEMTGPNPTDGPDGEVPNAGNEGGGPMTMALTSPAFNNGEPIPKKFTCDGEDISPELDWFGTPEGTVSMALIMDDPDAPVGTWIHWVVYNLPMDLSGLREGMTGVGLDGTNSWSRTGYGGPCPPSGTHRYYFKLYALDTNLDLDPGVKKDALLAAMEGHIIGQAELMGTYSR